MLFGKKTGAEDEEQTSSNSPPPSMGEASAEDEAGAGESEVKLSPEDVKKRMMASKQMAAAFGEIVSLLMRSSSEKHYSLTDLEWLVVPAVARGQYALAEAQSKETGAIAPVGAILWALVSEEVDKRLMDLSIPPRLKPDEWRSGDIPWVIQTSGDMKILAGLIQKISEKTFKDQPPKMRIRGADGKVSVGHIELKETVAENA